MQLSLMWSCRNDNTSLASDSCCIKFFFVINLESHTFRCNYSSLNLGTKLTPKNVQLEVNKLARFRSKNMVVNYKLGWLNELWRAVQSWNEPSVCSLIFIYFRSAIPTVFDRSRSRCWVTQFTNYSVTQIIAIRKRVLRVNKLYQRPNRCFTSLFLSPKDNVYVSPDMQSGKQGSNWFMPHTALCLQA